MASSKGMLSASRAWTPTSATSREGEGLDGVGGRLRGRAEQQASQRTTATGTSAFGSRTPLRAGRHTPSRIEDNVDVPLKGGQCLHGLGVVGWWLVPDLGAKEGYIVSNGGLPLKGMRHGGTCIRTEDYYVRRYIGTLGVLLLAMYTTKYHGMVCT